MSAAPARVARGVTGNILTSDAAGALERAG